MPMRKGPADFQLAKRGASSGENETNITRAETESNSEEDDKILPEARQRVFSIPNPPVLRRSPIGTRSCSIPKPPILQNSPIVTRSSSRRHVS